MGILDELGVVPRAPRQIIAGGQFSGGQNLALQDSANLFSSGGGRSSQGRSRGGRDEIDLSGTYLDEEGNPYDLTTAAGNLAAAGEIAQMMDERSKEIASRGFFGKVGHALFGIGNAEFTNEEKNNMFQHHFQLANAANAIERHDAEMKLEKAKLAVQERRLQQDLEITAANHASEVWRMQEKQKFELGMADKQMKAAAKIAGAKGRADIVQAVSDGVARVSDNLFRTIDTGIRYGAQLAGDKAQAEAEVQTAQVKANADRQAQEAKDMKDAEQPLDIADRAIMDVLSAKKGENGFQGELMGQLASFIPRASAGELDPQDAAAVGMVVRKHVLEGGDPDAIKKSLGLMRSGIQEVSDSEEYAGTDGRLEMTVRGVSLAARGADSLAAHVESVLPEFAAERNKLVDYQQQTAEITAMLSTYGTELPEDVTRKMQKVATEIGTATEPDKAGSLLEKLQKDLDETGLKQRIDELARSNRAKKAMGQFGTPTTFGFRVQ